MNNSAATLHHAPPPVALQENVPEDLTCSICMTVPAEPTITPCDHVFCRTCISQALQHNNVCPIDRAPCTLDQLKRLDGLSLRIWSGIQVKCGGHDSGCTWRGSMSDYSTHVEHNCSVARNPTIGNTNTALMEELETLRHENLELKERLEEKNKALQEMMHLMTDELPRQIAQDTHQIMREEYRNVIEERDSLRQSLNDEFQGSYHYRREHVVELSQLISRHHDFVPRNIDRNRIFNCVRTCYIALDNNYRDNPENYYLDMRMLLATCLSSNWFTDNQWVNIDNWYDKHFNTGG